MITLQKNGITKRVATGFSWKSFLFGCLYPIARGDYKGLFIQLSLCFITAGFSWLVLPFTYNKAYIKRCIESGWKPKEYTDKEWLAVNVGYYENNEA